MKEQISLTYAKQNYKRNELKYGVVSAFENAILEYYLQKEEIKSLYEYVLKITNLSKMEKYNLESKLNEYTEC
jgi:hypothetical protein